MSAGLCQELGLVHREITLVTTDVQASSKLWEWCVCLSLASLLDALHAAHSCDVTMLVQSAAPAVPLSAKAAAHNGCCRITVLQNCASFHSGAKLDSRRLRNKDNMCPCVQGRDGDGSGSGHA